MSKPKILITNDDGIQAPGIRFLWEALEGVADRYVIAPSSERSAAGLSVTIRSPLEIAEGQWGSTDHVWAINGTPVDCVKLGFGVVLDFVPDMVVSGINRGSNAGRNILYSGTVGGAIEGVMQNVPSIAFSCYDYEDPNYRNTVEHISDIVAHVLEHPLPSGTILNVNFPSKDRPIQGMKLTRQGKEFWADDPRRADHPTTDQTYWIGARMATFDEHEESDISWLHKGYIAAVPLHVTEMTDHRHYEDHHPQFDKHFFL